VSAAAPTPTITDRRRREAEARAARREELLDAAVAVVREQGPNVTMDQIAAACGVTKPIVYRHFGDRDGLVLAMALRFVDALIGALTPQLARRDAPRLLLESTIDAYLELLEHDGNLYRFLSLHEPGKRDLVAGLVAEQVATDTTSATPWAYGLVGMVHFAGDWWTRAGTPDRATLVQQLTALAWSGFAGIGLDPQPPLDHPVATIPPTTSPEEQ